MIKKTYVRVITLLLVALMILGVMAPAFTSYAASVLSITGTTNVSVSGTPDGSKLTEGKYEFKVQGSDKLSLQVKTGDSGYQSADGASFADGNVSVSYGGVTFKPSGIYSGAWQEGNTFSIEVQSVTADDEPQITAFNITGSSRITKGRSISIDATILDTNFMYTDQVTEEYVAFKQGDFKRGTGTPADSITASKGVGGKLQFNVHLSDLVYTGSGDTVEFVIGYKVSGEEYRYTMSMKILGCIPYVDKDDPEEDDEDVNLDPLIPHIIVSQYDYGTTEVSAGQVIDLNLSFENTSTQYDLDNIVMKITTPDGFSITSSSNTYHFDHLDVGESISKTISMQANPNAEAQSYAINIEFSFQYIANDTRKSGESSESISIPVTQPDRFSVDEIQVPTSLYVGDEYNLSINFVNKGKTLGLQCHCGTPGQYAEQRRTQLYRQCSFRC